MRTVIGKNSHSVVRFAPRDKVSFFIAAESGEAAEWDVAVVLVFDGSP